MAFSDAAKAGLALARLAGVSVPQAEPGWPVVVIASAFITGVSVARDLERHGVRVFLVDCDLAVQGFRSVYGTSLRCPNPDTEPDEWCEFMCQLAGRLGGQPALFAASDQFVSAIGRYAGPLSTRYRISPSAELQAELAVKDGQIRLAKAHGLPTPLTCYADSEAEVALFAAAARFPVLFKPRQHRFWSQAPVGHPMHLTKAVQANDAAELMRNYRLAVPLSPAVVLQELIQGPDTNKRVHEAIYRHDGIRLAQVTLAVLRCTRFGVPTVCEPIDDPEVAATCDRFFQSIGYRGKVEVELMWDERDGKPKMLDINPRFSGSGDAVQYTGIDQAWLLYLDLIGQPVEPLTPPPLQNFRHVMLYNDMVAIRQHWKAGLLSWAALRRTYRAPVYFWDFDWRDWRLGASTLWAVLRVNLGTLIQALLRRR